MSKPSVLALVAAAAISLSALAVASANEAGAAGSKQTVQPAKAGAVKRMASGKALQSFDQVRSESRINEAQLLRPPAQPGAW